MRSRANSVAPGIMLPGSTKETPGTVFLFPPSQSQPPVQNVLIQTVPKLEIEQIPKPTNVEPVRTNNWTEVERGDEGRVPTPKSKDAMTEGSTSCCFPFRKSKKQVPS